MLGLEMKRSNYCLAVLALLLGFVFVLAVFHPSKIISFRSLNLDKGVMYGIVSAPPLLSSTPSSPPTEQPAKGSALTTQQPLRTEVVVRPGLVQWKLYGRKKSGRTAVRKEVKKQTKLTLLKSVSESLQKKMVDGFPLNCHPGPEGLFKTKYEKILQTLAKYSSHHRAMKSEPSSRTLTWHCKAWCGGLADRLRGIVYSLLLAVFSHRRFIIFFDGMHEGEFLHPNVIDWQDDVAYQFLGNRNVQNVASGAYSDPFYFRVTLIANKQGVASYNIPADRMVKSLETIGSERSHVVVTTNIMPSNLSHPSQSGNQKWIASAVKWSGLSGLTDDEVNDFVGLAVRYLFKVDTALLETLQSARATLGLPGLYTALHIRTGFVGMAHAERFRYWKFHPRASQWTVDLNRAVSAANRLVGNDSLVFLATDSNQVKDMAIAKYQQRFRSLDNELVHVDHLKGDAVLQPSEKEGVLVVWTELFLLAEANTLVMGGSGFPWLAKLLCGLPDNRAITVS